MSRAVLFVLGVIGILSLQALALHLLGQPWICECGFVKMWEGVVASSGNSQHLTDWYTFSHIIHGFLFYLGLWFFFPRMSIWQRLVIATGIEAGWEIIENTPWLIDHYRQQALSVGYVGDSIINSLTDTISMVIGFLFAWRAPAAANFGVGMGLELWTGYQIRDGLALNVLNFVHQLPVY